MNYPPRNEIHMKCLSHKDDAFSEVGKDILKNSRTTLREFSNYMTSISSGAIATYILIVGLLIPKNTILYSDYYVIIIIPAIIYLICIVIFNLAYYPRGSRLNLNSIDSIEITHKKIIRDRHKYITAGMYLFLISTGIAISILLNMAQLRG
jgi:hypothetical protein